ncbi:MAG: hypothetical protein OES23_00170 [Nitrosopumilus sp.]|nr:hypothetical protein [Nitrosopumilus sp.]
MASKNKTMFALYLLIGISITFSLSASQSAFGYPIGDADPLLNNIWIEPKDPKPGDMVSIYSSVYNIGTQSTRSVSDVVTIGYFIDGNLVKIAHLSDVLPGMENGVQFSTGPIWKATDGKHTITVILNYHDTLSHLTDNLQNNIMQKVFFIGDWQKSSKPLISFDLYQKYLSESQKQQIKIKGKIILPENLPKSQKPRIELILGDEHSYNIPVDRKDGTFFFKETIPIYKKTIPITASFDNDRYRDHINYAYAFTSNLFPGNLDPGKSVLSLSLQKDTSKIYNFENSQFTIVVYDQDYNIIKKIDTNYNSDGKTLINPELLFTVLPGDTDYIVEAYLEGRLVYVSEKNIKENSVVQEDITIPELGRVRFEIFDSDGNPISDAKVRLWITEAVTNNVGIADWIAVLPIEYGSELYVGKITLPNGQVLWSEPFVVNSGEEKIIQVMIEEENRQ